MTTAGSPLSIYLDTSIFAGQVLQKDAEDEKCALLLEKISNNELDSYFFMTSKFTLVELAELIARKETTEKAKSILFDIMNIEMPIALLNPEPVHRTWYTQNKKKQNREKSYGYDIDRLISNLVNTALEFRIPGFDTIHAHTVKKLGEQIIAVSKDKDFKRFKGIDNVTEVLKASEFLSKYSTM